VSRLLKSADRFMRWVLVVALLTGWGCKKEPVAVASAPAKASAEAIVEQLRASEERAIRRERPVCQNAKVLLEGFVQVNADTFITGVERNGDFVDEPIQGLDVVVERARVFRFTLDYPFEKPFEGTIQGDLTLRKAISAIRAGFRAMYGASTVTPIPGMLNKQATGAYGEAFHDIDDLVIEGLELCDDHTLRVSIGS
jgi:hypothetical protein